MSAVASVNSFAITEARVYEGLNNEARISGRLPITIVTAIVSPIARPRPRITAPAIPGAPFPKTTSVVSHLVAPTASAASRCVFVTAEKWSEHKDAPPPVNPRRNRRKQLNQKCDRPRKERRRLLDEKNCDAQR